MIKKRYLNCGNLEFISRSGLCAFSRNACLFVYNQTTAEELSEILKLLPKRIKTVFYKDTVIDR